MSPDKGKGRSSSTRRGRQARPAAPADAETDPARTPEGELKEWTVRPASEQGHKHWQVVVAAEPELREAERLRLRTRPLDRSANPRRTARLKGGLASRSIGGKTLPQWQQELTAAGRLWYCPDKDTRTVWITMVDLQHPRATD